MDNRQETHPKNIVENPNDLIAICESVLDELLNSIKDDKLKVKQAQLVEVARSVDQLTKLGIEIPEDLRNLKLSLLADIETQKQSQEKLENLLAGLKELVAKVETTYLSAFPKKKQSRKTKTKSSLSITNQNEYRDEIIDALRILGGSGSIHEVMDIIEERMKDKFLPGDFERRARGGLVWKNNVQWARNSLREEGIIRGNSPRGTWELSEEYT